MDVRFRLCAFADLGQDLLYDLLALRARVFIVEQGCMYLDPDGKDRQAQHLIAHQGEQIVGYLRILPQGVSGAEDAIGRVLTVPEQRGRGIGAAMMRQALLALGERPVRLSAQAHLVDWYGLLGFRATSEPYLDAGVLHVDMRRAP